MTVVHHFSSGLGSGQMTGSSANAFTGASSAVWSSYPVVGIGPRAVGQAAVMA